MDVPLKSTYGWISLLNIGFCPKLHVVTCFYDAAISCHWSSEPFHGASQETINIFKAATAAKRGLERTFYAAFQFHIAVTIITLPWMKQAA